MVGAITRCTHPNHAMITYPDPLVRHQLPFIARIIQDETWLEAERRGHFVPPDDPVVRANVCAVVLNIGTELRCRVAREFATLPPKTFARQAA